MWGCSLGSAKEVEPIDQVFLRNGALLLEKLIGLCNGKCNPIMFFSRKELEKVTAGNLSKNLILMDENYLLYTGSNFGDRSITVKKYRSSSSQDIEDSIKEIAITSYVNHKNVLKLLGCCLENHVPIPVYEPVCNGSLSSHIYERPSNTSTRSPVLLPWESRLRIAAEIANAITYLHIATLRPIVHKNMKLSSVLLDHNNVAKLSDFGFATVIPLGETAVYTQTWESSEKIIAPPEYCFTGRVTEKSDVFNFGLLMIELLTGQRCSDLAEDLDIMLFDHVRYLVDENHLNEIVAPTILEERRQIDKQLRAFAELLLRCTTMIPEERPTMMEVAKELRNIKSYVHP